MNQEINIDVDEIKLIFKENIDDYMRFILFINKNQYIYMDTNSEFYNNFILCLFNEMDDIIAATLEADIQIHNIEIYTCENKEQFLLEHKKEIKKNK